MHTSVRCSKPDCNAAFEYEVPPDPDAHMFFSALSNDWAIVLLKDGGVVAFCPACKGSLMCLLLGHTQAI